MLVRLFNFFRGYVSLLLHGYFIERFINICTHRNIYMWDICKTAPTDAKMKMSINAFRQIRPIARKTRTRVRIQKKHGLPILMHRYRKRYFFFAGLILFAAFILLMSQFIWSIEVFGNERIPSQQILMTLEQLGLKDGAFKHNIDVVDLKNNALLQLDGLSWIWVDIKGSKAFVSVKEKTPPPAMVPKDVPCDIVATKPGVVKVVNAKTGKAAVQPGETVQKGQLLVSGLVTSEKPEVAPRYEHATGEVYARTWYEKKAKYPSNREIKTPTGKKKKKHSIKVFGKKINFYLSDNISYENYDKITYETEWQLGHENYIGITWVTDVYTEYRITSEPVSVEENLKTAQQELEAQILEEVGDGAQEIARQFDHTVAEDGTVHAALTIEFTEQIGIQKQIESPLPLPTPVPTPTPQPAQ